MPLSQCVVLSPPMLGCFSVLVSWSRNHDEVWLLGASAKDMGHGLCTVIKVDFTPEMVLSLLK